MKVIPVVIILGISLVFIFGVGVPSLINKEYQGKVMFTNQQEYTNFKYAVGENGVKIVKIQELSSNPPIIIDFDITTTHSSFAYGQWNSVNVFIGFIVGGFALILGIILALIPDRTEG
jgi:hypothetical protein